MKRVNNIFEFHKTKRAISYIKKISLTKVTINLLIYHPINWYKNIKLLKIRCKISHLFKDPKIKLKLKKMTKSLVFNYKINNSKKMEIWVRHKLLEMHKKHFLILRQKKIQNNYNKKFYILKKIKQQTKISRSQQTNPKKQLKTMMGIFQVMHHQE